jgi:release factor glutamine methyltransferase
MVTVAADDLAASLRAAGCVFADDEARLLLSAAADDDQLQDMLGRRVGGEPIEHIIGRATFAGIEVVVAPGVFVPRHRSEVLVDIAASNAIGRDDLPRPANIVDLCCGTGALSLALVAALETTERTATVHATDIDPEAVACARTNLASCGQAVHGDLFGALPPQLAGRVDVLLANVPYVPTDEIDTLPHEAKDHEARVALDGGADGLDVARRVLAEAPRWLAPRGTAYFECGRHQAPALASAAVAVGLTPATIHDEQWGSAVIAATLADERATPAG